MTLRQTSFLIFALCCAQMVFAQLPETINDPTAMTPTLSAGLKPVPASDTKSSKQQDNAPKAEPDIADPTRMNSNFRAALERLFKGKDTPSAVAPQRPALPKISLVASLYSTNKADSHAMLRINDQTKMVGLGDKFNVIDNNQLMEIEVIDIGKTAVTLQLKPSNERLILR